MKRMKNGLLVAMIVFTVCLVTGCGDNGNKNKETTNDNATTAATTNGQTTSTQDTNGATTSNATTGANGTDNGGVLDDIGRDIENGVDNLATDMGITGTDNNNNETGNTNGNTTGTGSGTGETIQ